MLLELDPIKTNKTAIFTQGGVAQKLSYFNTEVLGKHTKILLSNQFLFFFSVKEKNVSNDSL